MKRSVLSVVFSPRKLAAFVAWAVTFGAAGAASAQSPSAPPAPEGPPAEADDEAPVRGRPVPRDDRTGHFSAFAGLNAVVPAGDLGSGVTLGEVASTGAGAEVGIAVGITRYSGLELRGQFVQLSATSDCPDCATQMFSGGMGLVYHATQAIGFDPWVRFGFGYRGFKVSGNFINLSSSAPPPGTFHGVDVASFALGGDFFPVPWFGIGLFFEGDVGVMAAAPSVEARGAVYGLFQVGLRIALEPQRKAATVATGHPSFQTATSNHSVFGSALYNRGAR
ncbi:MAG: hypothetical protein IPK82_33995 [Polyangiaceae bacterium]|nr:hypothetical protein [Polyangiaceae bacterium]